MQAILIYLLKATICSGILFLYYHIALRNKRFHYYNRFYLLMSVALSLVLPFMNIELWQVQSSNRQVIQLMNVVEVDSTEVSANGIGSMLTWNNFLILSYVLVTGFLLMTFLIGIRKVYSYRRQYPIERFDDILFINTDLQQAPFSFFNNLFWKNTLDISDATGRQIFKHELTHIEQKHSWDKLFLRITTLILWMNPFYWLIQKELGIIHEFIADEKAIENKSAEAFALMLLQSQYGKNIISPAQSFNYSPIKRRLVMLTTSVNTSYSYARRIMVLPLLAITVLLFAFKLKERNLTLVHTNAPFTLLVDAGHGGKDAGAVGGNDVQEKDINLVVAKKVQELAPEYGVTVKMTRTGDAFMDPKMRMDVIEAAQPDAFVSIHVSTTEEPQTSKNEVHVYISRNETNSNNKQSRLLGSSLLQMAKNDFPINPLLMQRKEEGIYVIDHNPYPAVLFECGYINNPDNVRQLQDAAKAEQLARAILQGVVAYANADRQDASEIVADTVGKHPLYIVDGKETPEAEAKKIDGASIESINVLKDSTAVKVYGEKGKNGVLLIKLKKTSSGASAPSAAITIKPRRTDATDEAERALKVVDGKIVTNEELQKLDANSISSISVLKDESAVKKYGEKGKYGVVEITTKGKKNEQKQAPYFTPPVVVEDKNDSTVEFTSNTGLRTTTTLVNSSRKYEGQDFEAIDDQSITPPSFPGGKEGWLQYLQRNLKTDLPTSKGAPTGSYTVIVSFNVAEDGSVSDVKADNDPGYGTGAEAVRAIKEGPKWIPAKKDGRVIATRTKQSITFRVEEG